MQINILLCGESHSHVSVSYRICIPYPYLCFFAFRNMNPTMDVFLPSCPPASLFHMLFVLLFCLVQLPLFIKLRTVCCHEVSYFECLTLVQKGHQLCCYLVSSVSAFCSVCNLFFFWCLFNLAYVCYNIIRMGRDIAYDSWSCDLICAASSPDVYRINLEQVFGCPLL